jgi:hypothetical protein
MTDGGFKATPSDGPDDLLLVGKALLEFTRRTRAGDPLCVKRLRLTVMQQNQGGGK